MTPALFITDFDGTLLNDDKRISARDLASLERLRKKGVVTAIATGRSLYSFQRALSQMGLNTQNLPVDYLIFSTGAGIMSLRQDRIIRRLSISKQDMIDISHYFDRIGFDYMVHKAIPDTPYFLYKSQGRENPDFHHRMRLYSPFAKALDSEADFFEAGTQMLAVVPRSEPVPDFDRIRSDLGGYSVIHATSPLDHQSVWIEVFHRQASKSRAAAWLSGRLGIVRAGVVSVGNDYNDQDLLTWSGKAYAVANAPEDLSRCSRLAACNNQSGVTRAAEVSGLLAG